jgi:hypothetical protein
LQIQRPNLPLRNQSTSPNYRNLSTPPTKYMMTTRKKPRGRMNSTDALKRWR